MNRPPRKSRIRGRSRIAPPPTPEAPPPPERSWFAQLLLGTVLLALMGLGLRHQDWLAARLASAGVTTEAQPPFSSPWPVHEPATQSPEAPPSPPDSGWSLTTRLGELGKSAGNLLTRGKQALTRGVETLTREAPAPDPIPLPTEPATTDLAGELPSPGPDSVLTTETETETEASAPAPAESASPSPPKLDLPLPIVIPPQIAQVLPPASDASWPQVAGLDGLRFETPEGLQLDFHPHSRFRTDPQGLILLSGGALVHFPETGARLYLPEGHYLEARDTLCEVHSVEEDGILDVLDPQILVHSEGGEITPVHPLQRWYFSEGLASPIPVTEAGMLLRRLAWFRSGNRRTQAPVLARQLALRTLRAVEGSDREEIARETLRVAQEWVTRVARRYRDEAFARL